MLFHTEEERAAFFDRAKQNPSLVRLGSAMHHAESTHLGIWGDSSALFRDCGHLMFHECVQAAHYEGLSFDFTPEDVLGSRTFHQAFNAARRPREAHMHNLVRSLGTNRSHMDRAEGSVEDEERNLIENAAKYIVRELAGRNPRRFFEEPLES